MVFSEISQNLQENICVKRLLLYIDKLIVFPSLYRLLFLVALEQNLTVSQESLLIFDIPNEIISELTVNT